MSSDQPPPPPPKGPPKLKLVTDSTWRQSPLPGVNARVPKDGVGIGLTTRQGKQLQKLLRTFDNVRAVKEFAPYARSAEELCDAIVAEIAMRGFPVGPTVIEKIQTGGLMRMWGRYLFDKAAKEQSPQLAELASRVATAGDANFTRAHELHELLVKDKKNAVAVDPLAAFGEPPPVFEGPAPVHEPADFTTIPEPVRDEGGDE